jgi:hypothetical protein
VWRKQIGAGHPMITDFDNDGYRDIIVTNGYPRDVTDHDFITYRSNAFLAAPKKKFLTRYRQSKFTITRFATTAVCNLAM